MTETRKSKNGKLSQFSRTQVARATFAAAENMGISDRKQIDQLTRQVIEHLEQRTFRQGQKIHEQPQPLPGMEDLVPGSSKKQKHLTSESEILALVKEFLDAEQPASTEEVTPKVNTMKVIKGTDQPVTNINITDNSLRVLEKRYLRKDKQGNAIETPEEMFHRVARAIAAAETNYDSSADVEAITTAFYQLMIGLDFLPNSPTLMNAGRELGQLSACFVIPVEDSMESIFDAVKYTALIHKSGGGTGFSFSRLRPETDRVGSTGGVASGPVSFMRAFDSATDVIKQGGMRRGANMAILNVNHPDIMKFISSKDDMTSLTNFNISVAVTCEFMEAVKAGTDYNLINPRTGDVQGKLNAGEVFNKIVDNAWKTGDPGIVFIDRINEDNPTPHLGSIESTNPCGEQPLLPYESCNLGSINLSRMVQTAEGKVEVDYKKFSRTVKLAVRFLDDVIDVNQFPLPEISEMNRRTRKIGLGVMGFADMLIQLGIPYNSEEAIRLATEIMRFVSEEADKASAELASERGVFPAFQDSIYDVPDGHQIRNASRTTIAPTGTLSIIAGCSGGIEPLFALSYMRNILDGAGMVEVNPYFEETTKREGFYSEDLMQKLATGTQLHDLEDIPDHIKRVFVTAHEISPEWHVRMQAAFQNSTDNAVSKTVNFPREATREDVANVYLMAYDQGLKGITIYRDGSREDQPMSTAKQEKTEKTGEAVETRIAPRKRSKVTSGITEKVTTGCGTLYVTVNTDEEGICEVFSTLGKAGGCASAQLEATCRLISLALRAGVDVASVIKQLRGIRCPSIAWEEGKSVLSCADAIASVLEKQVNGNEGTSGDKDTKVSSKPEDYGLARNIAGQCPDCAGLLAYQEGCFVCPNCGYTKC